MNRDQFIAEIEKSFSGQEMKIDREKNPMITFPAAQKDVGDVFLQDDGNEITVFVEKITHGHFACYETNITEHEREATITEDVINFLQALFSDKVLLFTTADKRSGGWATLAPDKDPMQLSANRTYYLWSKPYTP